jgi:hypothetical protein
VSKYRCMRFEVYLTLAFCLPVFAQHNSRVGEQGE